KLDGLPTLAIRQEMRNQTDETLLTHWQDEQGDHSPRVADEARRRLVEKYQFLVYSKNRNYIQPPNKALLRCIDDCEPGRSFPAIARPAIYRAIRDYKQGKESGESGAVYRPKDSDDSFKHRWARPGQQTRPGQKAMLLASDANVFSDPLSASYCRNSDLSFDFRYYGDDDDEDGYEMIEEFEHEPDTFDRRRNAERIELDRRLKALNHRERFVIAKRYLVGQGKEIFERASDFITPGHHLKVTLEQAELSTQFCV